MIWQFLPYTVCGHKMEQNGPSERWPRKQTRLFLKKNTENLGLFFFREEKTELIIYGFGDKKKEGGGKNKIATAQ